MTDADFLQQFTKIVNTGQSRSVIMSGNIYDLFLNETKYVPLVDFLLDQTVSKPSSERKGIIQIALKVNRPIEVMGEDNLLELNKIWAAFHNDGKSLKERLLESNENPVYAFELLRQITECSRKYKSGKNNLLVIVEVADMLLPECEEISRMSLQDRKCISVVHDWLNDPNFINGHDTVVLLTECYSDVNHRISRLPSVASVKVPLPNVTQRSNFISYFVKEKKINLSNTAMITLAEQTSGLSLHAVRQLLCSGDYTIANIASKVEEYMISQLGEGVVEFSRPTHTLEQIIGSEKLKKFFHTELFPSIAASGEACISGIAVAGPIGCGKTYVCEALAAMLDVPVIVIKNIRSKWYGVTDTLFERLRRLLETFHKIVIFVDEADTVFGGVESEQETEKRLTGKIQSMMSDSSLRGKVIWFLMTARINRLSEDIRRPGRIDLIIPILDPEPDGPDHEAFVKWTFGQILLQDTNKQLQYITRGYSAASFAMLRAKLKVKQCEEIKEAIKITKDILSPDIETKREFQTLQAKLNCTCRSLLVDETVSVEEFNKLRNSWRERIIALEQLGY